MYIYIYKYVYIYRYIKPYYWVHDHPLLYGNHWSLDSDPSTYESVKFQTSSSWTFTWKSNSTFGAGATLGLGGVVAS